MTEKSHTYIYQDCVNRISCGLSIFKECVSNTECNKYQNTLEVKSNNMNSKELKMGDKVEVLSRYDCNDFRLICGNNWETRIFIKYGNNGGMIAATSDSMDCFLQGNSFNTAFWLQNEWRIPKEKTYRPFTWEERDQLRGKWIKNKSRNSECCIIVIDEYGIFLGLNISFKTLYESYTFSDGSPCGVLEE